MFVTADGDAYQGLVTDQAEYFRLTEYYAGRGPAPDTAPFTSRLLVPWLAARLPLSAPIAFNVVNLVLLAVGLASLVMLLRGWGLSAAVLAGSTLVYAVSFPVLWYSTSNWTDAGSVGLVGVCILAAYRRWWLGLLVLVPAVLAKETSLVCVAFGMALEATRPALVPKGRRVARMACWLVGGLVSVALARTVAGASPTVFSPWLVADAATIRNNVALNLRNSSGPPSVLLTALVPGAILIGVWWLMQRRGLLIERHIRLPLTAGMVGAVVLSAVSFLTALWDGRVLWVMFPFALPLGAVTVEVLLHSGVEPFSVLQSTTRPITMARLLRRLGVGAVAAFALILGAASVGRRIAPPAAEVDAVGVQWADHLGELRLDHFPAVEGLGRDSVPVPLVRSAPLLLDYDTTGPGAFSMHLRPEEGPGRSQLLVQRSSPSSGTVLVDSLRSQRSSSGRNRRAIVIGLVVLWRTENGSTPECRSTSTVTAPSGRAKGNMTHSTRPSQSAVRNDTADRTTARPFRR